MELLNEQIYSLDLDRQTDVFIINQNGVPQTPSAFYGNVLERIDIDVPAHFRNREVIEEFGEGRKWAMFGYGWNTNVPPGWGSNHL